MQLNCIQNHHFKKIFGVNRLVYEFEGAPKAVEAIPSKPKDATEHPIDNPLDATFAAKESGKKTVDTAKEALAKAKLSAILEDFKQGFTGLKDGTDVYKAGLDRRLATLTADDKQLLKNSGSHFINLPGITWEVQFSTHKAGAINTGYKIDQATDIGKAIKSANDKIEEQRKTAPEGEKVRELTQEEAGRLKIYQEKYSNLIVFAKTLDKKNEKLEDTNANRHEFLKQIAANVRQVFTPENVTDYLNLLKQEDIAQARARENNPDMSTQELTAIPFNFNYKGHFQNLALVPGDKSVVKFMLFKSAGHKEREYYDID